MHGLAVREAFPSGWRIGPGEDEERKATLVVQVGGVDRVTEVMAAEADAHIGLAGFMVQLVVVPQGLGGIELSFGDRRRQSGIRTV